MNSNLITVQAKRNRAILKSLVDENRLRKVSQFTGGAERIYESARTRGEITYGLKPWYCSAEIIENGADVVFIGANPGGGEQDWKDDLCSGGLEAPYERRRQYQAWLDDEHWGTSGDKQRGLQARVLEAFDILFTGNGEATLRNAASLNVVPFRSTGVEDLSTRTWNDGVKWSLGVIEHISPRVIVCLGSGVSKSAWSLFAGHKNGFRMTEHEERHVYNRFCLKRGRATRQLGGTLVIGLPHLSRIYDMQRLREVAKGWEIRSN